MPETVAHLLPMKAPQPPRSQTSNRSVASPKRREALRRAWRSQAHAAGLLRERWAALQQFSPARWDKVADAIAARYARDLPEDIRCARKLERLAHDWRLELETAFVDGADAHGLIDPALDTDTIRTAVVRVLRDIPKHLGAARTPASATAKRRRMEMMRFVQLCNDFGVFRWPRRSDDEDIRRHRAGLAKGLERLEVRRLDELVALWPERKPGAKVAGGHSKWRVLSNVLTEAWGDETPPTQLKKEWIVGGWGIGFDESNRYSRSGPNARVPGRPHDVADESRHAQELPRAEPRREPPQQATPAAPAPGRRVDATPSAPAQAQRSPTHRRARRPT